MNVTAGVVCCGVDGWKERFINVNTRKSDAKATSSLPGDTAVVREPGTGTKQPPCSPRITTARGRSARAGELPQMCPHKTMVFQ